MPRPRPSLVRMLHIHEALSAGRFPTRGSLAKQFETSVSTIQRDLDYMRDQMGLPIGFDPVRNGYHYTEKVTHFPTLQISEGELVALCVARRALEAYHGTSFETALRSAFHKLTAELHDELSFSWSDLDDAFSFRPVGLQSVAELNVFEAVKDAVVRQQEIVFRYCKPREQEISTRKVHPLHLRFQESGCYLFCHDVTRRGRIRRFHLGRMSEVQFTGQTFELKKPFDIDTHLQNSIGIYGAEAAERIHLRFTAQVAPLIRERCWHRTQQIEHLDDGAADFIMDVAVTPELERWVLGWGADVEVLAPISLRQAIAEVGRVLASRL